MKIEGGSLRCTAELGLQLGAEGAASAAAPTALTRTAQAGGVDRTAHVLAQAPATPARGPARWLVPSGKGEVPRPSIGYAAAKLGPALTRLVPTPAPKDVTVTSPLDFLRDSRLTAEEKLVLLLAQQQKDVEKEIDTVLKKAEAKSAVKQKSSGGVLGGLKVMDLVTSAVPGLGTIEKVFGPELISKAVSQLGGPVLAAAATALGAPELAPLALSAGPDLVNGVLDATVPFTTSSAEPKAANAPNAGAGSSTALDPVETQRLTLLVNRQQQWASTVSNLLHGMHQTRMNVIQNLR